MQLQIMKLISIISFGSLPTIITKMINNIPDIHQLDFKRQLRPKSNKATVAQHSRILTSGAYDANLTIYDARYWYGIDIEVGNPPQI